jgi:hypothetical protein
MRNQVLCKSGIFDETCLRLLEAAVPADTVAGTRYDAMQMKNLARDQ